MQQPPSMIPVMSTFPPASITTEQIQKYLDENKRLILAILDNQNLGKLSECAQYQTLLQKNLMYLAAIADAQPQAANVQPQVAPHPTMQQGGFYMQHPQAAAIAQQQGMFPPKVPMQFNTPHQIQEQQTPQLHQQHQQAIQGQVSMRSAGTNNGMHPMHSEATLGGGSSGGHATVPSSSDIRGGNKQDAAEAAASGADGQASATGHGGADGKPSYMKVSEEAK